MRVPLRTAAALALAVTLPSQSTNPIGYPADTVRAGSGNLAPFGLNVSTNADEARWQQLIPARYLPSTPCLITGLAVNCQSSNAIVTYTSLAITLSHTTATSLGNSFSANMPVPQVVLNATTLPIQWTINRWVTVPFTTAPFLYNGTDNLVVQIQKVYDRVTYPVPGIVTHQTSGPPSRNDLVQTKYAFGVNGSGASMTDTPGFTGSTPLSMRLLVTAPGTTTVASLSQPGGREFSINTQMDLTVWGVTGTVWITFIDRGFATPVPIPGIGGTMQVQPNIVFATGATSGGSSVLTIGIPNDPLLVGSYVVFQSLVIDPTLTSLAWTNGVDLFVNT